MNKQHFVIYITLLFLFACKEEKKTIYKIESKQLITDSTTTKSKTISKFIEPFKTHLNSQLDSVLCTTPIDLTRVDGKLESSLGNLLADICFKQGAPIFKKRENKDVDFVLLNYGGIRSPIAKGAITARNAFEVMPFENEMVVVELSGEKTALLFKYLFITKQAHPISNLQLKLNEKGYQDVLINRIPFDITKNYFILTSDYLQEGGDKMSFFNEPISLYKTDYKIRNAMIDYFKQTDSIIPNLDNRFTYAK